MNFFDAFSLFRCVLDFLKIILLKEYKYFRRKERNEIKWRVGKRFELCEYVEIRFEFKVILVI